MNKPIVTILTPAEQRVVDSAKARGYVQAAYGKNKAVCERLVQIGVFEVLNASMGSYRIKQVQS